MPADAAPDHLEPEAPVVAGWRILFSVFGFVACVAAGVAALYFYYAAYLQGPLIPQARTFPEPVLQTDPEGDLRRLLAMQREALSELVVGSNGAITKVPIERAMKMIVERGGHALDPLQASTEPGFQKTPGSAP